MVLCPLDETAEKTGWVVVSNMKWTRDTGGDTAIKMNSATDEAVS